MLIFHIASIPSPTNRERGPNRFDALQGIANLCVLMKAKVNTYRLLIPGVVLLLLIGGCRNNGGKKSQLFQEMFRSDTTTFRGIDPRDSLARVMRQEDAEALLHDDELGLAYRYYPREGVELLLDYHSNNLLTEQNTNHIASIVANILMEDEVETAKLYNEIQGYFNRKYGVSSGTYGDLRWEAITRHLTRMEIQLKMKENRRGLTLNFVDTDPESAAGS